MSYLKATDENSNTYRFSLMPANDTTSKLFPAVKTVKVSTSNTLSFGSISYVSGRKYYVTVKFRTRGDGDSTSSKCSSVGFIANRSDWSNSYSYIHGSATAYAERGQIVEWTYEFTASASESRATALYFIINNGWANGYDNQTIDLFYYKMWDEQGNIYAESSTNINLNKWEDGTLFTTEKAISETYDYYTEESPTRYIYGNKYLLEFDCKLDADEINKDNFNMSIHSIFDSKGGFSTLTIRKEQLDYSYKHFRIEVDYNDWQGYDIGVARKIKFDFHINQTGHKIFIKNVKFKLLYLKPMFLKTIKNNALYYSKLFKKDDVYFKKTPRQLQLMKNNTGYYFPQNVTEYKYNELASRTYQNLFEKFAY